MGRSPCCDMAKVKKGPWSSEEDAKLKEFVDQFGNGGNWITLPQKAGLKRCGKSCRLRWLNYLRPNIKHGKFSDEEDRVICTLYASIGSRWSAIAAQLPGRTDNDIKNYWNTKVKKKLTGRMPLNQGNFSLPFSGTLQTPPITQSPDMYGLSQLHNSIYIQADNTSLTAIQSLSATQNMVYSDSNHLPFLTSQYSHNYQPNQEGYLPALPYYPVKDSKLAFGGNDQASCSSSSDGNYSQISYGGDPAVKQEEIGCLQGFVMDGLEENQKLMLQCREKNTVSGDHQDPLRSFLLDQMPNGVLENTQLQYDPAEVKQLIAGGNNNFTFRDENSTRELGKYCN